ncbi:hypothetical protein NG773_11090, partial [Aliarcobacter cryaerophilus]
MKNLIALNNMFLSYPELLLDNSIKNYLSIEDLKEQEKTTINRLCNLMKDTNFEYHLFDNYYINYKIPQLGKEFDLLRIGTEIVINIELKSEKIDHSSIL